MPNTTKTKKVVVPKVSLPRETSHQKQSNAGGNNDQEAYMLMEKRDEQQIMDSLKGNYLEEYVYQFSRDGRQITGLSWIGIQEAAREYGGIQVPIDKIQEKDTKTNIVVTVEAVDTQTGSSRLGRSSQEKMMKTNLGFRVDEFADVKALSKAQRNAIRALLPQTLIKEFIKTKIAEKATSKPVATVDATKNSPTLACSSCQAKIDKIVANYSLKNYGFELCRDCQKVHQK